MTKEEAIKAIEEYLDTADEAGHIFPIKFLTALDMAISALKEPTWQEKFEKEYLFESIKEDMTKLQAENERLLKEVETQKGEWIPIEEREPEIEGEYWVTISKPYGTWVEKAWFHTDDKLFSKGSLFLYDVTAWREDIEPYKKGE